jgi:hypothetical protein
LVVDTTRSSSAIQCGPRIVGARLLVAFSLAFTLSGFVPEIAAAGIYRVHSCRFPDGTPASTGGWTVDYRRGDVLPSDQCSAGGSINVRFGPGTQEPRPAAAWAFAAPPDTRIVAYEIYRHVRVHIGSDPVASEYNLYHNRINVLTDELCNPSVCSQLGTPAFPRDPANRLLGQGDHRVPAGESLQKLLFWITCWRSDGLAGCPRWNEPGMYIYAADITLEDSLEPAITSLGGTLLSQGEVRGVQLVVLNATDRGGGLHRTVVEIDGRAAAEKVFDPNGGHCVPPFSNAVPCRLSGSDQVSIDTRLLADGPHEVAVRVEDAAGNVMRSGTNQIQVDNEGASCAYGDGARLRAFLRRKGTATRELIQPYGRRAVVKGRLRSADRKPIPQVPVEVRVRRRGAASYGEARTLTTDRRGRFRVHLRRGPTRRIRLSYCAPGGGGRTHLRLVVRARARLHATPRSLRNGETVRFRGKLLGTPIPASGVPVTLQARAGSRWITFATLRSDGKGRFNHRYTFRATTGHQRYRFRARIGRDSRYPYSPGRSNPVTVEVQG